MAKHRQKNKTLAKDIAYERITYLFEVAGREYAESPARSNRYVSLAKRIGMRYRVSLPQELKRKMCKGCGSFLSPGGNCRVRLKSGRLTITCMDCGRVKRYPLTGEEAEAKEKTGRVGIPAEAEE
ncbi:MAG: ribonuclease P protein component 4 [Methanolobus sp.]|uniref:ribonuclease P protein component 4 n=1 Tax=Methanolobus sp. TaxID=1874737 RepID=UPI002730B2AA|nr:ribonuclease P protein component 4 [Methanolobus sp.]MDP2216049.1 ribonuclease P protein component 4 [Methanolobus sp.]